MSSHDPDGYPGQFGDTAIQPTTIGLDLGKRVFRAKVFRLIAERTRAALARKKLQGAKLGNRTNLAEAQAAGASAVRADADAFAANVLPIVRQIQAAGVTSTRDIAAALNARGIRTARGGEWHHSTVRNLLVRGR